MQYREIWRLAKRVLDKGVCSWQADDGAPGKRFLVIIPTLTAHRLLIRFDLL
jgi:hypothetical protein